MIWYLAHPWSNDPNQSFRNAIHWTFQLRLSGLNVFSPILHIHPYWKYLKNNEVVYFDYPVKNAQNLDNYKQNEDWLAWDLALLKAFMKGDGGLFEGLCGEDYEMDDSGVTILLSRTAFGLPNLLESLNDYYKDICEKDLQKFQAIKEKIWEDIWYSSGCRTEYEFAKAHHIRVLELEAFLEGREVDL